MVPGEENITSVGILLIDRYFLAGFRVGRTYLAGFMVGTYLFGGFWG